MTEDPKSTGLENTDRELWREREGDYYADSIFVTKAGAIGINCGGTVHVAPLRAWFNAINGVPWRREGERGDVSPPPAPTPAVGVPVNKDTIKSAISEMCAIICDDTSTDDEKKMALDTLHEAIEPSSPIDLEKGWPEQPIARQVYVDTWPSLGVPVEVCEKFAREHTYLEVGRMEVKGVRVVDEKIHSEFESSIEAARRGEGTGQPESHLQCDRNLATVTADAARLAGELAAERKAREEAELERDAKGAKLAGAQIAVEMGDARICELQQQLADAQAEVERMTKAIASLFDAIKHGDAEHQAWLAEKIRSHFELAAMVGAQWPDGEAGQLRNQLAAVQAEVERLKKQQDSDCESNTELWHELRQRIGCGDGDSLPEAIDELRQQLSAERKAREEAERERDYHKQFVEERSMGLTIGGGLMVWGSAEAIMRAQSVLLIDSTHLLAELQAKDQRIAELEKERDQFKGIIEHQGDELSVLGDTERQELKARIAELEKQLPESMRHCTILLKECDMGHHWLTAMHWTPFDCPTCVADENRQRIAELEAKLKSAEPPPAAPVEIERLARAAEGAYYGCTISPDIRITNRWRSVVRAVLAERSEAAAGDVEKLMEAVKDYAKSRQLDSTNYFKHEKYFAIVRRLAERLAGLGARESA